MQNRWTCKIVGIPRNGDGGDWCSTADGNCHGLVPSFFVEVTRCQCQKYRWRCPGDTNGRSKFHKYSACLPILLLWYRNWCYSADGSFQRSLKRHVVDVKIIAGDDQVTLRINWNSTMTEIYTYEIKQGFSKNIFLLFGHLHYDAIAQCFFPTITHNGFCSHLRKQFCDDLDLTKKPRYIEEFFVDSIYANTIDIIK